MNRRSVLVCILIIGLSARLCFSAELRAVATTTQVGELVSAIGGNRVELKVLMGSSVDPHLYKATARDVQELQRADIIFYNGLHLEGRMTELFERLSSRKRVVAVTERMDRSRFISPPEYEDTYDPHVWFDMDLWQEACERVRLALSSVDPDGSGEYAKRTQSYQEMLSRLSAWGRSRIEEIPEGKRVLITSHDAYNYFGRYFGLRVIGVQGISTATEAGLADVTKTVDFIREHNIPAIFVESSVSPAAIERISNDAGVEIGGELYSDAMGAKGELRRDPSGTTYEVSTFQGMLKYNIDTIVRGLSE